MEASSLLEEIKELQAPKYDMANKIFLGAGFFSSVYKVNRIEGRDPVAIKEILLPLEAWMSDG